MRYPEQTERLIVMNSPHPWAFRRALRTGKQLRKSWYMFFFQIPRIPEFLLGLNHAEPIGRMLYASAVQKAAFPPEVVDRYREAMSKPRALTGSINYYRSLFRRPPGSRRGTGSTIIHAPTLLIWGEQDVALGIELTYNLEQWVPNIQIKRLPDSGHWVQQELPDTVNALMLDFLRYL
jgi:pimeloyl-ACP methyl ester carboxylesterase